MNIYVGAPKQKFSIHKNLICGSSKFFDRAFNGGFIEAAIGQLDLPEDSPTTFEHFVGWLYRSRVDFSASDDDDTPLLRLIDLYNFGDAKLCSGLKNAAMDSLQDLLHENHEQRQEILNVKEMTTAFRKTVDSINSPLRMFFAHLLHWYMFGARHGKWTADNVSEFLAACPEAVPYYVKVQHKTSTACIEYSALSRLVVGRTIGDEICKNPLERNDVMYEHTFETCFFHVHERREHCVTPSRTY